MRVELHGGLNVSRLGFGCAGLMARLSRAQSLRLLETAFDAGITHFDVARMYGYGEAERVVGEFAAGKRSQITLTSKAGILPPSRSVALSAARGVARRLATIHPAVRRVLRRRAEAMTQHGSFHADTIRASFATSLHELRVDHLDVLLLHECTLEDLADPELADLLQGFLDCGKVRQVGVATRADIAYDAHARYPALASAVQFANNPWQNALDDAGWAATAAIFAHSPLGSGFPALARQLAADASLAGLWSREVGFDVKDTTRLGEAFLAGALEANPAGCVLFSSQKPERIKRNASVRVQPGLWATLCRLTSSIPASRVA